MKIELLYFEGCPSYQMAEAGLREVLAEAYVLDPIHRIEIKTEADAQRWNFPGSPTIRIDGADAFEPGATICGLECRVYQTPDGLRGWPTQEMLRDAVNRVTRLRSERMQGLPA